MAQDKITYKIVAIGGSAGSLDVIINIVSNLPVDSGASFVIVLHRKADHGSILVSLLSSKTDLPVKEVDDKDIILQNCIYLAPADYHLLIEDCERFSLDSSEKIHYSRPSIDVTFESIAEIFGEQTIGVLLSGANADGAAGMAAIKNEGGYTIVQNPVTAQVSYMPQQAIQNTFINQVANAEDIPALINSLIS